MLLDRARVLIEHQPSPFDERETGAVEAAMSSVRAKVASRMNELNCGLDVLPSNAIFSDFMDLVDAVRQARPVAEREASEFVDKWAQAEFRPRYTYEDIAGAAAATPDISGRSRGMRCRAALDAFEELARSLLPLRSARELLDTQQRGSPSMVKDRFDARASELFEVLEENRCLEVEEPDFRLQDVRDLWRDVSLSIIRPSADLAENVENFRRLLRNIGTPPSERFGTLRAVPGTEEEALRREGEISGVRIGSEGLLSEDLTIEFDEVEGSALRWFTIAGDGEGGVKIDTGPVVGIPSDEVVDRVLAVAEATVVLEELEGGQQFGRYQTDEAGEHLVEFSLSAGTPVRTDDVGDLITRAQEADPGAS